MLIGVAGKLGSGKDTVAEMAVKKGYLHLSLSDILREDLKRQGKEVTRDNLVELGARLRRELGSDILATRAFSKINNDKVVITSIGRTEEVEFFKRKEVKIIYVDASPKIRFERIKQRSRENDPITFPEFLKLEKIESKGKNLERNFDDIKEIADIVLTNNSTLDSLQKKMDLITQYKRPDWDSYFFEIMNTVAKRATCGRGRCGAVITRNNQILTTGYVGSPPGLPHCDEVGHLMTKTVHPDGIEREHCVRTTHAEQNAIAQAAKNGITLEGATIYINMEPCFSCAKQIISSGIKRIVCLKRYQAGQLTRKMLKEANIELIVKEDKVQEYET
jgi:dCMP deaminase